MNRPVTFHKPRYQHDCKKCVFLGRYGKLDIYWCDNSYPNLSSVIARQSSRPDNYASTHPPMAFAGPVEYLQIADKWYHFALKRAKELNLFHSKGWDEIDALYAKAKASPKAHKWCLTSDANGDPQTRCLDCGGTIAQLHSKVIGTHCSVARIT